MNLTIELSDDDLAAARRLAAADGASLHEVVRRAIRWYVGLPDEVQPEADEPG